MAVHRIANDARLRTYYSSTSFQPVCEVARAKKEKDTYEYSSRAKRRMTNEKRADELADRAYHAKNAERAKKLLDMAEQLERGTKARELTPAEKRALHRERVKYNRS